MKRFLELLRINRAISIRRSDGDSDVRIGYYPPFARVIRDPPAFFDALIKCLATPCSLEQVLEELQADFPSVSGEQVVAVVDDLIRLGVVVQNHQQNRYDRHQLYFQFLGVTPDRYLSTVSRKRIGILGAGGIGSTVAALLGTAGISSLMVVDDDLVELTNLTRTLLFRENDLGHPKVDVVAREIAARNSSVTVETTRKAIDSRSAVQEIFANCDLLVLSADTPPSIHEWVDDAFRAMSKPYITAGYVELSCVIGPLLVPPKSACLRCNRLSRGERALTERPLNEAYQAASYSPMNMLSASITVNEILRFLLGLRVECLDTQILIDSRDYTVRRAHWVPHAACECGAFNRVLTSPERTQPSISI